MTLKKGVVRAMTISCLLLLPLVMYAQHTSVEWINKNAHELHSDSTSTNKDLLFLSKTVKDKTIVGLGEASHGTQEFFFQKRRIVEYLVSQDEYRLIGFEFAKTSIEPINNYVQTGKGDLKGMIRSMMLYNSDELYKLCQWLKVFNNPRPERDKVKIIGFDDEEFWSDPFMRDENMAKNFIKVQKMENPKSILWSHNIHLAKDTTMTQYKAMGYHVKKHYGDNYYVVGFDTYHGTVNVLNNGHFEKHKFEGKENTFSSLFSKVNYEAFFVGFHEPGNPLLNTKNLITNIYSDWREPRHLPIVPGADFDGLIFIRKTTASKDVK